jgi:hypothetical protein
MLPFVGVALRVKEELHINDKKGSGMVMKFAKIYSPEKMGKIMRTAKTFYWWESNPVAAFMLALKTVNKQEKDGDI